MMVNLLPAILIGGPPHAGKSVLFYSLTQALRERGVSHHAIRACPDGEGNWSQEAEQETVQLIRIKGKWSDEFVERLTLDLSRRLLPMIVDVGGRPKDSQIAMLQQCTHSLLLLKEDEPSDTALWLRLVELCGLVPLAQITSSLKGKSTITSRGSEIRGTLVGLQRGTLVHGPLFDLLVERITNLFTSYSRTELEHIHLDQAPTELVIRLPSLLQTLAPGTNRWEPQILPLVLSYIPANTAISVYGQAPHWLYGALAAHAGRHEFYQFDPRLRPQESSAGWVSPPSLQISKRRNPDVQVHLLPRDTYIKLTVSIVKKHLDYLQAAFLPFPSVPAQRGLILDGSMPSWLVTALVRLYATQRVGWIACHQPQLQGAVVVASSTDTPSVGDVVPIT